MQFHLGPREVKDVFSILKDCAAEANQNSSVELQVWSLNQLLWNGMMVVDMLFVCICIMLCWYKKLLTLSLQITYGVLFSLVATFISDALSTLEKASLSSSDSSFRREFHELVSFDMCIFTDHCLILWLNIQMFYHCDLWFLLGDEDR